MENQIQVSLKDLNAKDKMLIVKQLENYAKEIYDDNKTFILNQIIKAEENYSSDYGKLEKRHYNEKTVAEVLEEKQKKLEELQKEISTLEKLNKDAIIKEESNTLVAKPSSLALDKVKDLTQDIIKGLASKRLEKSASKVKKG